MAVHNLDVSLKNVFLEPLNSTLYTEKRCITLLECDVLPPTLKYDFSQAI